MIKAERLLMSRLTLMGMSLHRLSSELSTLVTENDGGAIKIKTKTDLSDPPVVHHTQ